MSRGELTGDAPSPTPGGVVIPSLPDRRSAVDYGPYSGYCKLCWNPVYVLWADSVPPPGTCVVGAARACECADALGRAESTRNVLAVKERMRNGA